MTPVSSTVEAPSGSSHNKPCTLCGTPQPVLVRCQIDESGKWNFVCPGKCWRSVSGGFEDAKGHKDEFPHYRYGGMWKNRHADGPLNAKKPRKMKKRQKAEATAAANTADNDHDESEGSDNGSRTADEINVNE